MAPKIIFGTASFGMDLTEFQDAESVKNILKTLKELGINDLDTAARYPPLNPGRSEQLIGLTENLGGSFNIDTKVYTDTKNDGSGDLTSEAVQRSITLSLERLQQSEGIHILYAHRPDPQTPLEEQIKALNDQVAKGRCKAWGVSNFPPSLLEQVLDLCDKNGWQKPSAYQGQYSVVTRGIETVLLPLLRKHGIAYNAFHVLEAGFLSGKFVNNEHENTRLDEKNPLGKIMQGIYSSDELKATVKKFDAETKALGVTPIEVAVRWAAHHSALGENDGIILGASKTAQIVEVAGLVKKGPLPESLLKTVDDAWAALKDSRANVL